MSDTSLQSINDLARAIAGGLSPVAIVEDCLRRISERNADINAMILVDQSSALDAARQAQSEIMAGRYLGPLHGIPVSVKDVVDVAGWPTTAGSRLSEGRVAEKDAACVANLKAAGAIIIGKTNMHELTVGNHANPWYGKVVNPLDVSRGPGGTSSGSAAAVATGFCVAAIGTDTGGSNRSTAAATGLFGFKPTNGRIDATGVWPTAASLDTIGPIARTADDARLVTEAMFNGRTTPFKDEGGKAIRLSDLTFGLCPDLYAANVDASVEQAIAAMIDRLRGAGAAITELPFQDAEALIDAGLTILQYEFAGYYGRLINETRSGVGEAVLAFLDDALRVDKQAFDRAKTLRAELGSRFAANMSSVDALLVPTSPGLAPHLSDETTQVGETMLPYGPPGGRFRRWANMFNMPALAIPVATESHLPASVQLATSPGQDTALFEIAAALARFRNGEFDAFRK